MENFNIIINNHNILAVVEVFKELSIKVLLKKYSQIIKIIKFRQR